MCSFLQSMSSVNFLSVFINHVPCCANFNFEEFFLCVIVKESFVK
jgi:hypothetical protein